MELFTGVLRQTYFSEKTTRRLNYLLPAVFDDGDLRDALKILDREDRENEERGGAKIPLASYEKVWGALLALGRPVDTDTLARALTPAGANLEGRQAEMFAALIKGARTGNSLAVLHAAGLWSVPHAVAS